MRTRFFILQRPRHPLARLALALLGLAVFGALLVFGLIALAVLVAVGGVLMLVRAWRGRHADGNAPEDGSRPADPEVLEGEYVVIRESRHVRHS
jgi:fatty acid desaturase